MQSVLGEIEKLRGKAPITIDYQNKNRYRLVIHEAGGSKTAYYFSVPIYNLNTRKLVDVKFRLSGGTVYAAGSNAVITLSDNIFMENAEGSCSIEFEQKPEFISAREVRYGNNIIVPTANGIAMKCNIRNALKTDFVIEAGQPFLNIRANDKCFALMKEKFRPLVVLSCIGCFDFRGNVIAPAEIEYRKLTDSKYRITISATSPLSQYVMIECNLYENKLLQDTTVDSASPSSNNAFGSVGFIGNTLMCGEQWLYSRLDYSRLSEIIDRRIQKMILHIPRLNSSNAELRAFNVSARFCSFGSNWNNKIAGGTPVSDSYSDNGYQSIDITSLLVDPRTKTIVRSEGMILRPKIKGGGFSVISTGDSCYAPQIMEVNFR